MEEQVLAAAEEEGQRQRKLLSPDLHVRNWCIYFAAPEACDLCHAAAKAAAEARSIEERVLAAAEEERQKQAAAARKKRLEEDQKRREAQSKQRREIEGKVGHPSGPPLTVKHAGSHYLLSAKH